MKASTAAHIKPMAMPPKKLTKNVVAASSIEKVPVVSAATANWNDTTPDASLIKDSPDNRTSWRLFNEARCESDATATASVGPSAAPRANAAASGMLGCTKLSTKPTTSIATTTRPTASDTITVRFDQRDTLSTWRASS